MAQKKLIRFKEIKTFSNVLEYPEDMAGKWKDHFKNNHPITLELACGKGEYTVGMAQLYPERNFIGVDVKGNRLWAGAKFAVKQSMQNVAFLRTQIDKIAQYFNEGEVREIWITFPDPHLRISKARKRLTHPKFLRMYHHFLKPGGLIHLKTDSPQLYQFTKTVISLYELKTVADHSNLYRDPGIKEELKIKTHYEALDIAQSNTVFYLSFQLPESIPNNDDPLNAVLNAEKV